MSKRLPTLLIEDMLESIEKIERYTGGMSFDNFSEDERTIDAVVRNFEIIGEACRQLPQEFKAVHTTIPWREIADFRNLLIHDYFGVSLPVVWNIVTQNLPDLKRQLAFLKT
ncbi:DUF86 domain-containing protein [Nibrella saemangeumensis]|uniref:DUF86 domain-containing protein n=1 Tax=Nibrella saemangeumensis TaxID=1084526 RepID=A0ABP8N2B7_9BACT